MQRAKDFATIAKLNWIGYVRTFVLKGPKGLGSAESVGMRRYAMRYDVSE
jgi:hypothetical protein